MTWKRGAQWYRGPFIRGTYVVFTTDRQGFTVYWTGRFDRGEPCRTNLRERAKTFYSAAHARCNATEHPALYDWAVRNLDHEVRDWQSILCDDIRRFMHRRLTA